MRISLAYGHERLEVDLRSADRVAILKSPSVSLGSIELALAAPIASPPLHQMVRKGQRVVILASDITRPCPSHLMLPAIMEELGHAGVRDEDITVVFARGVHRALTAEEFSRLIGPEMCGRLRCLNSDPDRVLYVGTTRRGTPIEVFEPVVKSDVRIALGNVELHYFAGYTGGSKALVPGVCSARTIHKNHSMMADTLARAGVLDGNPVREDIEEGAALVGLHFILNVVLNGAYEIVAAAAGHPVEAHRWACRVVDYLTRVEVRELADVVVVSAGGYPKDIDLYQAQKALESAAAAVRPGGLIIWVAECMEGFGNTTFEAWLIGSNPGEILKRIRENFVLGGHKAAAIARVLTHAEIWLVSKLPAELVRACGLAPYSDLEGAVSDAISRMGPRATITVIPEAAAVHPTISSACQ